MIAVKMKCICYAETAANLWQLGTLRSKCTSKKLGNNCDCIFMRVEHTNASKGYLVISLMWIGQYVTFSQINTHNLHLGRTY